ncbi:hypothetical protein ACWET9_38730 [Streptomyces sp. NPDC004059]|uniref:hypothetical protein n=1 Tax=Streptomyces sp. NPDC051896 TaxID=3155416 RepID=UPI003441907F
MTTPKTAAKRPSTRATDPSRPASRTNTTQRSDAGPTTKPPKTSAAASGGHTITITLPALGEAATRVVTAATVPVATARRLLPAKDGLPLYAGLGVLAVVGALEWPVAAGVGIGYAVLRSSGLLTRPGTPHAPAKPLTSTPRGTDARA